MIREVAQMSHPGEEGHHVPPSPSRNPVLEASWSPVVFINDSLLFVVAPKDFQ